MPSFLCVCMRGGERVKSLASIQPVTLATAEEHDGLTCSLGRDQTSVGPLTLVAASERHGAPENANGGRLVRCPTCSPERVCPPGRLPKREGSDEGAQAGGRSSSGGHSVPAAPSVLLAAALHGPADLSGLSGGGGMQGHLRTERHRPAVRSTPARYVGLRLIGGDA